MNSEDPPRVGAGPRRPRFQLVQTRRLTLRWRLLGRNNVALGAGATDHTRPEQCRAAIGWLCAHLPELHTELDHVSGGRWRWRLSADGTAVAETAHPYGRRIEALHGLERFRLAAAEADPIGAAEPVVDWRARYPRNSADPPP